VRRGLGLTYATAAYNSLESLIAIGFGLAVGSVALVGFGFDSLIELTATGAAIWRLYNDADPAMRAVAERRTLKVVGWCFLLLAAYVGVEASRALLTASHPEETFVGIVLAALSLIIMPLLARAKRKVAREVDSEALAAEAMQTMLCTYLSAILLVGLMLNAFLGWWWADPVAALAMTPIIAQEGFRALKGKDPCGDDCHLP